MEPLAISTRNGIDPVAQTAALRARAVRDCLTELLAQADPLVALSPDVTVRTIFNSASAEVGRSFIGQPEAEATVRTTIGQAYTSLGEPELAEPHLRQALAIREQLPETSPAELYATLRPLTDVLLHLGHPDLVSLGPRAIEVGLTVIGETRLALSVTPGQLFKAIISGQRDLSDRLLTQALEQERRRARSRRQCGLTCGHCAATLRSLRVRFGSQICSEPANGPSNAHSATLVG